MTFLIVIQILYIYVGIGSLKEFASLFHLPADETELIYDLSISHVKTMSTEALRMVSLILKLLLFNLILDKDMHPFLLAVLSKHGSDIF